MERNDGEGLTRAQGTEINGEPSPGPFSNVLSLIGVFLAAVSLANIAFLVLIDALSRRPSPYIGILAYVIMPALLVLGLLLIPAGALRERHRWRKHISREISLFPRIDLNVPAQRSALALFFSFVFIFVILSAVGSYHAYEITESVEFCGQTCHTPMNPEFQTYLRSPHARVVCVDCHVGTGANWYIHSKLSGVRQLQALLFKTFPRPIPTPVAGLRPARETCEECHWPVRFLGNRLKVITHFASDENNTPRQVRLLMKIGGGGSYPGGEMGIHWHVGHEVTYAATDPQRLKIDWVQTKDPATGKVVVYKAQDATETEAQLAAAPKRTMDCIDCHNRPTHIYPPPDRSVDQALLAGRLDPTTPFIKQQAVTVLTADYKSTAEAMQGIGKALHDYYAQRPAVQAATLDNAIREVQHIYSTTIFPEMKVDWRSHPDNIGHFYYVGCFRCHDGQHVSPQGKTLPNDCNLCHTVMTQESGATQTALPAEKFNHPGGELPEGVKCMDCHTGGVGP